MVATEKLALRARVQSVIKQTALFTLTTVIYTNNSKQITQKHFTTLSNFTI